MPFYDKWGIIPNEKGRVTATHKGEVVPGEYVVGWAKRGPTGVIGTNKPDAVETVAAMLEDVNRLEPVSDEKATAQAIVALLQARGADYFTFEDWLKLEAIEDERGKAEGRPRVKITSEAAMLAAVRQ